MIPIRLLWKLLLVYLMSLAVMLFIVSSAIEYLAADYFVALMERYNINPVETHQMFLEALQLSLGWAGLVGCAVALVLYYLLLIVMLRPLWRLINHTNRVANGDYKVAITKISNDEFGELEQAFNRMTERLREVQEFRKSIVINIAHELRTPLTHVQGYLEGLKDGVLTPSKTLLRSLHEETLRLNKLVEDLLKLVRADAAKITLNRRLVDPKKLLETVLALFVPRFANNHITVTIADWPEYRRVSFDPEKITQVLHNLLQNALSYTPVEGYVKIFCATIKPRHRNGKHHLKLTVVNSGSGIAKEDLPFIFERFYRSEKSRSRHYGGAGVGLAIVKELVNAHGGDVGAYSSVQETQVWFTIPIVSD